jgi:hypothetical protein
VQVGFRLLCTGLGCEQLPRSIELSEVAPEKWSAYPVSVLCEVLVVSASGYFNWLPQRESDHGGPAGRHSDEALLAHIRAIHAEVKGDTAGHACTRSFWPEESGWVKTGLASSCGNTASKPNRSASSW